jgi:RNA recognition motif-containing protein
MKRDPETKKLKTYCYVEFTNEESVENVLRGNSNTTITINDREAIASRSQSSTKLREQIKHVVHITNLSYFAKEKDIEAFFSKNQIPVISIIETCIVKDENGKSKGFAFVEFDNEVNL